MLSAPLRPEIPLEEAVRVSAAGLLDDAMCRLTDPPDVDRAVHESRKRLKEVRSLLRLMRFSLTDEQGLVRDRANARLRDAAGLLSAARDAAVLVETLSSLRDDFLATLDVDGFEGMLDRLRQDHAQAAAEAVPVEDARSRVAEVRAEVDTWRLRKSGWRAIGSGLQRIHSCGRGEYQDRNRGVDNDHPEAWHDWRKRAKDLRYAVEFLRQASPLLTDGWCPLLKQLTDHLGSEHDLQVLHDRVGELHGEVDPAAIEHVTALIATRRATLQQAALRVGAQVYAERPDAFVRRVRAYWRSPILVS
jgi:CHAD domain-containing protein